MKWQLKVHMGIHDPNKPMFQCDRCNKSFTTALYLKTHLEIHDDLRRWECQFCPMKFNTKKVRVAWVRVGELELEVYGLRVYWFWRFSFTNC